MGVFEDFAGGGQGGTTEIKGHWSYDANFPRQGTVSPAHLGSQSAAPAKEEGGVSENTIHDPSFK